MPTLTNAEINTECTLLKNIASNYSPYYSAIFNTMFLNGCRTIEAVSKNLWDISNLSDIKLTTAKFGDVRHIDISEIDDKLLLMIADSSTPDRIYSTDEIRKVWNKFTKYPRLKCLNKQIGCHLFRHNKIKQMYDNGSTVEEISSYMGHSQLSSTMGYILSTIYY